MAKTKKRKRHACGAVVAYAPQEHSTRRGRIGSIVIICLILVVLTASLYWQTTSFGFLNYDDNIYVFRNADVVAGLSAQGMKWAFNIGYAGNWHPLTWMSHMLDVSLYGTNPHVGWGPGGHHFTNVLLHTVNSVLLFALLAMLTGMPLRSGFVAALFAVHPLHVESVAWVAERKDVLSAFFWILTTIAYVGYTRSPKALLYVLVVFLYALGLMAKPMLVTLPITLLLLDIWPLRRLDLIGNDKKGIAKLAVEKTPLFVMAIVSGLLTIVAQSRGQAIAALESFPFTVRAANALNSFVTYLVKTVWPIDLATYYPHPGTSIPPLIVVMAAFIVIALTAFALYSMRRLPYVAVGWFWYLVTLLPVIGLLQVGNQAMADRYTYIPLVGVFVAATWGICDLVAKLFPGRAAVVLALPGVFVLVVLSCLTYSQIGYWSSGAKLFDRAVKVTKDNWFAHHCLGCELSDTGKPEAAIPHFLETLRLRDKFADAHMNLAIAYQNAGRLEDARREYEVALSLDPKHSLAHSNYGNLLNSLGKYDDAEVHYRKAIECDPKYAEAYNNLAVCLCNQNRIREAEGFYRKAIELKPEFAQAHDNLGLLLSRTGRVEEGARHFRIALQLEPNMQSARDHVNQFSK